MSPPVVLLPLNQELMDANIGLEELQQFQHVDNVVELQLQPVSPPPPRPPRFLLIHHFFDKVNNMMETFNKFVPFLSQLGSARRSPTAGPSDIVSPNPVDRVPGTAPQSPDVAPGPSSASLEPRASGSGLHLHRDDKFATPRGQSDKGDQHSGIRHASQPPSPSHQDRLREKLEDVHRQLSHTREIVDFYRAHGRVPPDQSQDDLENLQAQYAQISIALEESLYVASSHRRGPSPASSSHRVASPPDAAPLGPHSSSLRGSRRSDRPRSPSHDRSHSRDAFSGHPRPSCRSHERYEERIIPSDAPAHRRRPRSRDSPSPRHLDFPSKSPSPRQKRFASQRSPSSSRERFASRGSSSPKRMRVAPDAPYQERFASRRSPSSPQERFASRRSPASSQERFASRRSPSPQRGHPHLSEWDSLQTQDLAPPGDPFLGILALQGHAPPGIPSLQREVPLPLNDDAMSRGIQSLLSNITHLELRLGSLLKRDPIHGLLLPALLLLRERKRS